MMTARRYPDYAYDFSGISIKAGDTIKLTVTATSTKAGSAVIQNLSTGVTVTKALTSTAALQEGNAEWIVEDFSSGPLPARRSDVPLTPSQATLSCPSRTSEP